MGRKTAEIRVTTTLPNHHDELDARYQAAWERFVERVRQVAQESPLQIEIDDLGQL